MMRQIRRYARFGVVLLLPAYFTLLANSVMNRHTHVLPNGIMVTHAHPYAKNANGESQTHHQHSGKGFVFLQSFCIDFYTISDYSFDFTDYTYLQEKNVLFPDFCLKDIFLSDNSQRAPPFFA